VHSAGLFPAWKGEPGMRTPITPITLITAALLTSCASTAPSAGGTTPLDLRDDRRAPACNQGRVLVCNMTGGLIRHYDECRCRAIH